MHLIKHIVFICLVAFAGLTYGQSKKDLEKKKSQIQQDIAYKNKLLQSTSENKKSSLNQLVLLNTKITERSRYLATLRSEVNLIERQISKKNNEIKELEGTLDRLKKEYASMIQFAYKNRNVHDKLMFILAADDFNQAYKRIKYFQQYSEVRTLQVKEIQKTEAEIVSNKAALQVALQDKTGVLEELKEEKSTLDQEQVELQKVYSSLKEKESGLKKEIENKKNEQEKVQKAIERLLASQLKTQGSFTNLTPEAKALAADFGNNKGKLPWPVERGVITSKFGIQPHPVLKNLKVQNQGVTITTESGSYARAVFKGTVLSVLVIPGAGSSVLVQHGNYITVYGNIGEVMVKTGDVVDGKQKLGKILTIRGKTELEFQIRHGVNAKTLNPSYWIFKAK